MSLITEYESTVMQAQTFSQIGSTAQRITQHEIAVAQQKWCDSLVEVSQAYNTNDEWSRDQKMTERARIMITDLYDYKTPDGGAVLFRPTLTYGEGTFRPTYESALSYFVGAQNVWETPPPQYEDDRGFAKNYINSAIGTNLQQVQIFGNIGITMGNVTLEVFNTDINDTIQVDKVFIFRKDKEGKVRIILHKSALSNPFPKRPTADLTLNEGGDLGKKSLLCTFTGAKTGKLSVPASYPSPGPIELNSGTLIPVADGAGTTYSGIYTLTVTNDFGEDTDERKVDP